jgi:hypothetical protein
MPKAKSPRTVKPKTEKVENNILHMPENGNGRNGLTPADVEPEIRLRAYELYLKRNGAGGSEKEDWLAAEREVLSRYAGQTHTA